MTTTSHHLSSLLPAASEVQSLQNHHWGSGTKSPASRTSYVIESHTFHLNDIYLFSVSPDTVLDFKKLGINHHFNEIIVHSQAFFKLKEQL